jgi:hypothetical protein
MNLNDILQSAQGGQGINNLATQFGLTPAQVQSAVQAMIPAFSMGLQRTAQDPTGLGGILTQMTNSLHQGAYVDPNQASAAAGAGGNVLGQIFGSPQVAAQVGQQAAQATGINPQILQQMMPVIASMIMGGLFHNMANQGLGGILGQLAGAANQPGGLGSAPGMPGGFGQAGMAPGGMLGGVLGSLFGGLFGGQPAAPGAAPGAPASPQATAWQAGLNTLSTMFQAGVQVSQAHQQGLNDILNSMTPPNRS